MTIKFEYLRMCSGRIQNITNKLREDAYLPCRVLAVEGELNRLKEAKDDLLSQLTKAETEEWNTVTDNTLSPEEMAEIVKRMSLNKDREGI